MTRGFTLLELLAVLVLAGLLAGMVIPGAASLADRLAVEHEASRVIAGYRTAWHTAAALHRLAIFRVTADSLVIRTVSGAGAPDTLLAWLAPGPSLSGVTITGAPHTTVFAPNGMAMGLSNVRLVLGRGAASRQVLVSRLGRVRILP